MYFWVGGACSCLSAPGFCCKFQTFSLLLASTSDLWPPRAGFLRSGWSSAASSSWISRSSVVFPSGRPSGRRPGPASWRRAPAGRWPSPGTRCPASGRRRSRRPAGRPAACAAGWGAPASAGPGPGSPASEHQRRRRRAGGPALTWRAEDGLHFELPGQAAPWLLTSAAEGPIKKSRTWIQSSDWSRAHRAQNEPPSRRDESAAGRSKPSRTSLWNRVSQNKKSCSWLKFRETTRLYRTPCSSETSLFQRGAAQNLLGRTRKPPEPEFHSDLNCEILSLSAQLHFLLSLFKFHKDYV